MEVLEYYSLDSISTVTVIRHVSYAKSHTGFALCIFIFPDVETSWCVELRGSRAVELYVRLKQNYLGEGRVFIIQI